MEKSLVNPLALRSCAIRLDGVDVPILDISFIRIVTGRHEGLENFLEAGPSPLDIVLDRFQFRAPIRMGSKGEKWLRLGFENIVPSCGASLRSFLSPKKVGESLIEDWRTETLRHFHGLNESELWFDSNGGVLFTYLDQNSTDSQFIFRVSPNGLPAQIGSAKRSDYMELAHFEAELPLLPLTDREVYSKLSECRDVITNFRPDGQIEYHLKQRLLKVISDNLYSTGHRVDISGFRNPRPTPVIPPSRTENRIE